MNPQAIAVVPAGIVYCPMRSSEQNLHYCASCIHCGEMEHLAGFGTGPQLAIQCYFPREPPSSP